MPTIIVYHLFYVSWNFFTRFSYMHAHNFTWRRQWHPTPVLLPGKSHGWKSLVQSMGLQRVWHDWATSLSLFTFRHWRRKWIDILRVLVEFILPFTSYYILNILCVSRKCIHLTISLTWTSCLVAQSCLTLFVTTWTVALQAPLSMGFSRQEHWSGLSFPFPGHLPNPGIKPESPALTHRFFTAEPPEKPQYGLLWVS